MKNSHTKSHWYMQGGWCRIAVLLRDGGVSRKCFLSEVKAGHVTAKKISRNLYADPIEFYRHFAIPIDPEVFFALYGVKMGGEEA